MEYMGLDKKRFEGYIKELMIMYSEITPDKARLMYEFFVNNQVTIEQLEKSKNELYKTKTSGWFPTTAEIYRLINKKSVSEILGCEVNL